MLIINMDKKILMPIILLFIIGIAGFVSAEEVAKDVNEIIINPGTQEISKILPAPIFLFLLIISLIIIGYVISNSNPKKGGVILLIGAILSFISLIVYFSVTKENPNVIRGFVIFSFLICFIWTVLACSKKLLSLYSYLATKIGLFGGLLSYYTIRTFYGIFTSEHLNIWLNSSFYSVAGVLTGFIFTLGFTILGIIGFIIFKSNSKKGGVILLISAFFCALSIISLLPTGDFMSHGWVIIMPLLLIAYLICFVPLLKIGLKAIKNNN
jgi:hypothetical protein